MNFKSVQRLSLIGLCCAALGACQGSTSTPTATDNGASEPLEMASTTVAQQDALAYPGARTVDQIDNYHGTEVADPYRWLEQDVRESPEVRAWADSQQQLTRSYLDDLAEREPFAQSLRALWNYEREGVPRKAGSRYFSSYNDGLMNQDQVRVREQLDGPARVLIDPNEWAADGTTALAAYYPSPDGRYLAYLVQEDGSDWRRARVLEVATGKVLPDDLRWLKFTRLSWRADSSGFYYSRYPEPDAGAAFQSLNKNHALHWHPLGVAQADDVQVRHDPANPDWGYDGVATDDGDWLVTVVRIGTDARNQVVVQHLRDASEPRWLVRGFEQEYQFIGHLDGAFLFKTDLDAPLGRVVAIDSDTGALREVVAQTQATLIAAVATGGKLLLEYLRDARSELQLLDPGDGSVTPVELPTLGSVGGIAGKVGDTEAFFSFSSFAYPSEVLRLDTVNARTRQVSAADVGLDPKDYVVQQAFAQSADGTRVPYFVVHKQGLTLNKRNPTILYGYGGFAIPMTPQYSTARMAWLQKGGIFVLANLRGGGEYGKHWHDAGTKTRKQNVFADCIAVAEALVASNYTSAQQLAIMGGSNGGLLVGAVINQRPELFKAALPMVGVMDMLRFHRFTAGRFWVDDYGSADDPEEFKALHAYSPYHNIVDGQRYPATMVFTADTDDRVVPGHSFKYAARLQAAADPAAPALLYVESNAGHGAGTPTDKLIGRYADSWAFLWSQLAP